MKRILAIFIVSSIILHGAVIYAQEEDDMAEEFTANDKFTRGIVNIATCYLEVPMNVYETSKDENVVTGLLYGMTVGVAKSLVRLAIGAVELGTFPFEPYSPLMEPEYLILKKH